MEADARTDLEGRQVSRFRPLTLEQAQQMFLLGVALYLNTEDEGRAPNYVPRTRHFVNMLPVEVGLGTYAVLEE